MEFAKFIEIIRSCYPQIIITMDQNNNNNDNRRAITLSAPGNPSNFAPLPIVATNDILTKEDISNVQKWLIQYSRKIDKSLMMKGVIELGRATIVWDDSKTGSLPDGYTVINEDSGAYTIFDASGQNRGSLNADASLSDKDTLVLMALAEDISEEWVSDPPDNSDDIVLPVNAMEITTRLSESDTTTVIADLNTRPGMGPLSTAPLDELNADRLSSLSIDVGFTLAAKDAVSKTLFGIPATTIDGICKDNGFQFKYIDADGTRRKGWYLILDNTGNPIAGGELKKPVFGLASDYYLTDTKRLQDQIRDAKMLAAFAAAIPPEQVARTARQETHINDFLTERRKGPDKPVKGPDPETKDPHGNGQEGPGN